MTNRSTNQNGGAATDRPPYYFSVVPRDFNLTPEDIANLEACGIPFELQKAYGIRRVTDEQGAEIVGQQRRSGREFGGLAFPIYSEPGGCPTDYELRRDTPDEKDGKETGKYLRPPGRGNRLCFPHTVTAEELADVSIPVIVCEGIKKMLALEWAATYKLAPGEKRRFIPVAIGGVWNWRGTVAKTTDANGHRRNVKGLLAGFKKINSKHRPFYVLFDNDTHSNYKVRVARHECGEAVRNELGAIVYFVDLPKSGEVRANG